MAGPPVGADEPEQVRGWVTTVAIDCNRGYDAAYVRASLWPTDHAALGTDQACRARRRGRPTTRGTTKESWHGHPVQAPPTPQASLARRDVGADPGVAGVEVDLPAWVDLPGPLPRPPRPPSPGEMWDRPRPSQVGQPLFPPASISRVSSPDPPGLPRPERCGSGPG